MRRIRAEWWGGGWKGKQNGDRIEYGKENEKKE